jgi:hypothetical protein
MLASRLLVTLATDDSLMSELRKSKFTSEGDVEWAEKELDVEFGEAAGGKGHESVKVGVSYEPVWLRSELDAAVQRVRGGGAAAPNEAAKQEDVQVEVSDEKKEATEAKATEAKATAQSPEGELVPEAVEEGGSSCAVM